MVAEVVAVAEAATMVVGARMKHHVPQKVQVVAVAVAAAKINSVSGVALLQGTAFLRIEHEQLRSNFQVNFFW